jgi:hypothetical protein
MVNVESVPHRNIGKRFPAEKFLLLRNRGRTEDQQAHGQKYFSHCLAPSLARLPLQQHVF